MLYDGDCPLCMREVNMLRKRDKDQNKIRFVDISSAEYSPDDNAGITYEQVRLSVALSVYCLDNHSIFGYLCRLLLDAHCQQSCQSTALAYRLCLSQTQPSIIVQHICCIASACELLPSLGWSSYSM